MKLLFLANRIPYPPYRGDKLKIYNLARALHTKNQLVLVAFYENHHELKYKKDLLKYYDEVHLIKLKKGVVLWNLIRVIVNRNIPLQVAYFKSRKMTNTLNRVIKDFDPNAIHIQHLRMAQFIDYKNIHRALLDLPDAISMYFQRRKDCTNNPIKKRILNEEYIRLLKYENSHLKRFKSVLCCSQEDLNHLLKRHPGPTYKVLENGVDTHTFQPHKNSIKTHEPRILFTGNMDYAPNVDAVCYFAHEIFPKIKEKHPTAIFEIAGQKPLKAVLELNKINDVEVTGFVPRLQDAYARASVVVAPIRFGAGTQNKVLEALCMEVPVVCTPIGFFGLSLKNGDGIYCEENTTHFINRLNHVLDDLAPHKLMATRTGAIIRNKYSWTEIAKKLEGYFKEIAEKN